MFAAPRFSAAVLSASVCAIGLPASANTHATAKITTLRIPDLLKTVPYFIEIPAPNTTKVVLGPDVRTPEGELGFTA